MAYSVAYQHTDSNRNHDGSDVVHGTLETEQGLANHRQTLYIITVRQKKEARGDFLKQRYFNEND